MSDIIFRKANWQDCDDVFAWLNDQETIKASFRSDVISYDAHREWFKQSLEKTDRFICVAENKAGEKVGVVRLDKRNEHVAEFDINLAPGMRGQGLGSRLIERACQGCYFGAGDFLFVARAKKSNQVSVKVFKKAGFFEMFDYVDSRWGEVVALGRFFSNRGEERFCAE